jgi:hypothetical protein
VICAAFRGPRCPPRSFRAHSFAPNGHRESSLCPDQHQIWYLVRTAHCRNSRQVANLGQTWRARAASWKGLWTTSVRFSSQRRKEQSDRQPRPLLTYNLWLPRHFPRRLPAPPWSSLSLLVLAFFDGLYFDHCRRCHAAAAHYFGSLRDTFISGRTPHAVILISLVVAPLPGSGVQIQIIQREPGSGATPRRV